MRLLVYRYGYIGDTVATLPALWALRRHFQGARVTLLSELPAEGNALPPETVLPPHGLVDEYLKYRGGASIRNLPTFVSLLFQLRRRRFDTVAYLVPSTRSRKQRVRDAAFFRLAGVKHRIGFEGFPDDPFPRGSNGALVEVPAETDALLQRLAVSGIQTPEPDNAKPDLALTPAERDYAAHWLRQHVTTCGSFPEWFAICPGSKWASKRWPFERYVDVSRRLWLEHRLTPVIVGGTEDRPLADRLIAECGIGACAAGQFTVRQTAALLERAAFYVGNDSGPMHLAAAVGTPCVAIFSAQDWPGRWYPYGSIHEILRFDVPCAGCFSPICERGLECLTSISSVEVYAACTRVLERTRRHVSTRVRHSSDFNFGRRESGDVVDHA